jgi:dynein heavy chain
VKRKTYEYVCIIAPQGIRWIINREEPHGLVIIQQSQHKYIDKVIYCIENGLPLLIENLPVDIDAVLDPVIGKTTIKKGRNLIMKIGDAEVRLAWGEFP